MPFLSKVPINPMRDTGRRAVRNPHVVHGMVLAGLPGDPTTQRVLWRLETTNPHRPELLILTETKPDWTHIVEQAGWPHADGGQFDIRDYTPLFTHLATGREFAFRLTARPVENTTKPDKLMPDQQRQLENGRTRGFRIPHRTAAHQLDWLLHRTASWGFEIPLARTGPPAPDLPPEAQPPRDVRISARDTRTFRKNSHGKPVVLVTATFDGRLRVTDPDLLRDKLLSGLGPGKAYGCGLLTLAPLPGSDRA